MINRVVLVGRLTKDPVMRKTASAASVVSFTVACDRRVKSQDQSADFINCVAWNRVAELMSQYLHKGSLVGVEGRIQTRSYDDQTGKRVYVTEIYAESVQFLDTKSSNGERAQNTPAFEDNNSFAEPTVGYTPDAEPTSSYSSDFASSDTLDIASDDLPF